MSSRMSAVAGQFYPATCSETEAYMNRFNKVLQENNYESKKSDLVPQIVIVPHAGYIYSGFTANMAYMSAAERRDDIRRVIVIGPSHRVYVKGASIGLYRYFDSPCGELGMDIELSNKLSQEFGFLRFQPDAHHEHSTEVQMPFIKHYFQDAEVLEIVYGDLDPVELSLLIDTLLEEKDVLIVISTDLSHFHTQQEARLLDTRCIEAMADLDIKQLERGCEACGMTGVKAAIISAKKADMQSQVLDYRSSADVTQDKSSVVGYTSCLIGKRS